MIKHGGDHKKTFFKFLAWVSKTIAAVAVATAFRVLYWWRKYCKQISNGRFEIFKKIVTLLTVTVLFLFTFFNLILDAPRTWRSLPKKIILFVLKNLGLDPDPDWIRIQQQPRSGYGFSKIPTSGSRFSESGSETLHTTHSRRWRKWNTCVVCTPSLNPILCLTYGLAVCDEVDHEEADSGGHGRHNHRLHHLQPGPRHVPERTRQLNHN